MALWISGLETIFFVVFGGGIQRKWTIILTGVFFCKLFVYSFDAVEGSLRRIESRLVSLERAKSLLACNKNKKDLSVINLYSCLVPFYLSVSLHLSIFQPVSMVSGRVTRTRGWWKPCGLTCRPWWVHIRLAPLLVPGWPVNSCAGTCPGAVSARRSRHVAGLSAKSIGQLTMI